MSYKIYETSTSDGLGDFSLTNVSGSGTFDATYDAGDASCQFEYLIEHETLDEWESGVGYLVNATTLNRTTVTSSSNSNNPVNFTSGTKHVRSNVTEQFTNSVKSTTDSAFTIGKWKDTYVDPSGDPVADTIHLKKAMAKKGTIIAASNSTFYLNDTIVIDPLNVYFHGGASTFDMSAVPVGIAFKIDASGQSNIKEASARGIEHLIIKGSGNDSLDNIGLLLETTNGDPNLASSPCLNNIFIRDFGVGIKIGHYAYIASFTNVRLKGIKKFGIFRNEFITNGENVTFTDGVIADSEKAFQWSKQNAELRFYGTSFDYNKQIGYTDNRVEFHGCHFESNSQNTTDKFQFEVDNGGQMIFIGGDLGLADFNSGKINPALPPADYLFKVWGQGGKYEIIGMKTPMPRNYKYALTDRPNSLTNHNQAINTVDRQIFNFTSTGGKQIQGLGLDYWASGDDPGILSNTSPLTRLKRTAFKTDGGVNATTWIRPMEDQLSFYKGEDQPDDGEDWNWQGGFIFKAVFGINDPTLVNGARMFIGVQKDAGTPDNRDPASIQNCVGLAQLETNSSRFYFVYGGNTPQSPIILDKPGKFITLDNTRPYELSIYAYNHEAMTGVETDDQGNITGALMSPVVTMVLTDLYTGDSFSETITGDQTGDKLPANDVFMRPILWRSNNTVSQVAGFDFIKMNAQTFAPLIE